jgi:hypothetical protein
MEVYSPMELYLSMGCNKIYRRSPCFNYVVVVVVNASSSFCVSKIMRNLAAVKFRQLYLHFKIDSEIVFFQVCVESRHTSSTPRV